MPDDRVESLRHAKVVSTGVAAQRHHRLPWFCWLDEGVIHRHIGAGLGEIAANRRIRARIVAKIFRDTAHLGQLQRHIPCVTYHLPFFYCLPDPTAT